MALTLEEKLELQVAIMQDLDQLDKIDDIAERFAVQLRIKENLDKLEEDSPAPTGMTEEYRKLLAGEYNGLVPEDFKKEARSICVDEASAYLRAINERTTIGALRSKAAVLIEEPVRRYLEAHYDAEKDIWRHTAV